MFPSKDKVKIKRIVHYHQILHVIFQDLIAIQKTSGITYNLPYPDSQRFEPSLLKPVFLFLIGEEYTLLE